MTRLIYIFLLFVLAVPMIGASHALFLPPVHAMDEQDDVLEAIKRGDVMPYSKIKRIVESKLDGVVVGQQIRRTNRGWQYDMRVRRKDGRVVMATVDARTGEIVRTR